MTEFVLSHPSYDNINFALRHITLKMDEDDFRPTLIIGLARGGLIPAVVLSQSLGVTMKAVHYSSKMGQGDDRNHDNILPPFKDERILIIDDICDSGNTMHEVFEHYNSCNNVRSAVIYHKDGSIHDPSYTWYPLQKTAPFIIFPWERNIKYMNL